LPEHARFRLAAQFWLEDIVDRGRVDRLDDVDVDVDVFGPGRPLADQLVRMGVQLSVAHLGAGAQVQDAHR
jgi:hypothetical protein